MTRVFWDEQLDRLLEPLGLSVIYTRCPDFEDYGPSIFVVGIPPACKSDLQWIPPWSGGTGLSSPALEMDDFGLHLSLEERTGFARFARALGLRQTGVELQGVISGPRDELCGRTSSADSQGPASGSLLSRSGTGLTSLEPRLLLIHSILATISDDA